MAESRAHQILAEVIADGAADGRGNLPALLCRACVVALPLDGAGLWVMTDHGIQSLVAVTDGTARVLEDLQFTMGEGPCIDAFAWGRPVVEPELAAAAARWPGFGPAAVEAGAGAVFAFPLQLGSVRLGVLDLYRKKTGPLTTEETLEALAFTDAATMLLLYLQQGTPDGQPHPQLDPAWTGRPEVHQASGMVSVQAGVSIAQALLLLRGHAFAQNLPVGRIARDIVDRHLRFDRDDQEFSGAGGGRQ